MDKTQEKLVELTNNLTALEACIANGSLNHGGLILFLQYDVPLEETCENYAYLKGVIHDLHPQGVEASDDRNKKVVTILRQLQDFIIKNDRNGSQIQVVYKQTLDQIDQICNRLEAPYPEKAAF
jgi:uncharacterized protein YicC (UPF0701 family)